MVEFSNIPKMEEVTEHVEHPMWNLFVDGSVGKIGSGAGMVFVSPEGHKLNFEVRFKFKVTNNVAEC